MSFILSVPQLQKDHIPPGAILKKAAWDQDISLMDEDQVKQERQSIESAIRLHRDIERERTADDDRMLYAVLPEKLPADFRLQEEEEFLGTAKKGAGCPNFWKSHSDCKGKHQIDQWGPCR
jgi:hypothetical protein